MGQRDVIAVEPHHGTAQQAVTLGGVGFGGGAADYTGQGTGSVTILIEPGDAVRPTAERGQPGRDLDARVLVAVPLAPQSLASEVVATRRHRAPPGKGR